MRELISPLAGVEVLDVQNGERVIIPSTWERHIFHRDFQDLIRLRRVSTSGGFAGTIEYNCLGLVHLASTQPAPPELQTIFQQYSLAGLYMQDTSGLFVEQPVGFDCVVVGDPIRGIIPAPLISQVRFKTTLSSYLTEDLFPQKYNYEFILPKWIFAGTIPNMDMPAYYGGVSLMTEYDDLGNLWVSPILNFLGQEIDMWIVSQMLRGSYLLGAPISPDVVRISSQGVIVERDTLLAAAKINTEILRSGVASLLHHPGAIKYKINPLMDNRYDPNTAQWYDIPVTGGQYAETTLGSFLTQSPPIPIPDYSFMFIIQLNTPLDQRYHLYSMSSAARIFFGNHYMIEFVPSAGGAGKVRFYFFPLGYHIDEEVWSGRRPPADSKITAFGTQATAQGFALEYLLRYLQPTPNATEPQHYVAPFVFVREISEMDVWSLSKITPGATAEAFMVIPLKGHICILKVSDIFNAVTTGNPVRPIFAFNPVEYIHRNFGNTSLGLTLLEYFKEQTIPKDSSVGLALYNCSAYISFCDFGWRGASIQTKPTMLAPPIDSVPTTPVAEGKLYVYTPFKLRGTSDGRKIFPLGLQPSFPSRVTIPPSIEPITGVPPTITIENPSQFLIYPILHAIYKKVDHPDFEPVAAGEPVVETCIEALPGVVASVSPVSAASLKVTIPSSKCIIIQNRTRLTEVDNEGFGRLGGLIASTDLGISPSYFPDAESFHQALRMLFAAQPQLLYEVKMASARYVPAPPLLLAADLVRAALFTPGDLNWVSAVDLGTIETELSSATSVIKGITVNLVGDVGASSAQVILEIPYNVEPILSPDQNIIINLPPFLRRILRPYNLIRIRLGYTMMTEKEFVSTLSPVIFEGVITSVGASLSAESEGGGRALRVTISAQDIFYRASLATTDKEPPIDGWFLPEVIEYQMVNSGILPDRLVSNLWFPLGATASYLVGDTLFVGGTDAYLLYSDYPFHYDVGLKTLVDAPRFQIQSGTRRLDVIKQALRLSGAELIFTPYPIPQAQINSFLDFVLKSLPYERFSSTVQRALASAKLPYSLPTKRETLWAQVLPVGSYAIRPTWVFQVQQITIPSLDEIPTTPALLHLPVILPEQPFIHGIFSLQWENVAWALPTFVSVEGERIRGQPFIFSFYDYYHELINPDNIAFKGFRISSYVQRNPNIVDPMQAFLAAMREYLRVGYFPPIKATLTLFGMPILGVKHLIALSPSLRIFGADDFVYTDPTSGLSFWVVNAITYDWSAESPYPRMTISLTPPHRFLTGLFGLG